MCTGALSIFKEATRGMPFLLLLFKKLSWLACSAVNGVISESTMFEDECMDEDEDEEDVDEVGETTCCRGGVVRHVICAFEPFLCMFVELSWWFR
jgi:hypothetical protein